MVLVDYNAFVQESMKIFIKNFKEKARWKISFLKALSAFWVNN